MKNLIWQSVSASLLSLTLGMVSANAATYEVGEDVMTSPFFTGTNLVRGYAGDGRAVHRVSSSNPFGLTGAETLYLDFSAVDLSAYSGPVTATLTVTSASGGFGADADAANPFLVSAHAVDADPLSTIADDTNPSGTESWSAFFDNHVLAASTEARTSVDGFGLVSFDVSSIVNDWISGSNSIQFLALTGLYDTSGTDFLHGFVNNSEAPGSTYLSVSAVPVPAAVWLMLSALGGLLGMQRQRCS
jgi:hypothetical protein